MFCYVVNFLVILKIIGSRLKTRKGEEGTSKGQLLRTEGRSVSEPPQEQVGG